MQKRNLYSDEKIFILSLFLLAASKLSAATSDLDSLKQKLQLTTIDSLKGPVYEQIAAQYLQYDTIKHTGVKLYYQSEALNYTMLALHNYSFYADTLGMRTCFNYLSKVYTSQRKFSQAKWFLLQSNKISRDRHDTFNIITSLVQLSNVKMSTKDYKLAMRDLNEALALSTKNNMPKLEALVQQNFAFLYNRMTDYEKGDIAAKRAQEIYAAIKQDEELKALAAATTPTDSTQVKPVAVKPAVAKKKLYTNTAKKPVKATAVRRLASI